MILRSEEPALINQEQRIVRGLSTLQAEQQAGEAVKRRNTYESNDTQRSPLENLNC
jgi:hypothetical protein